MKKHLEKEIQKRRQLLQNQYAFLDGEGGYQAHSANSVASYKAVRRVLENPWAYLDDMGRILLSYSADESFRFPRIEVSQLLGSKRQDDVFTRSDIELIVRRLQGHLWHRSSEIWPKDLNDPVDVLDPAAALGCIGYSVQDEESLGQYFSYEGPFEVAGIIDKSASLVRISKRLPRHTRSFTMAHELGHAILHADTRMHRDRALDGSIVRIRDSKEFEADIFAALFLLPEKQVRLAFSKRFLTKSFFLNEATAFALNSGSFAAIKTRCKTPRNLSRLIAGSETYNGKHFNSLADHFDVSVETMAIRLEELQLIQV